MSDLSADDIDFGAVEASSNPQVQPARPKAREASAVAGERAISPIAGRFGVGKGGKAFAFLGLLAGSGVFLAATWTPAHGHKAKAATEEPARQSVDFASVRAARPPMPASAANSPNAGAADPSVASSVGAAPTLASPGVGAPSLSGGEQGVVPAIAVGGGPASAGSHAARADGSVAADPKIAAAQQAAAARAANLRAIRSAPLLAYSSDAGAGDVGRAVGVNSAASRGAEGSATELDQLRRGSAIGLVHAQRLPDRNFLLTAGALLPCVLETAMDTSAPGYVTCRISRDVYSDSGGVVLMEKGSRVIGEYRSGFQQGRARIFVLWNRITTAGGVAVDVSSPAADPLGRAGADGQIDSHFWQRFGGALLLTSVSGGISAAAEANARYSSIVQAPQEAATAALQTSINIPPTLRKPQGAEVAIFVSHDLDFSSVYALKAR